MDERDNGLQNLEGRKGNNSWTMGPKDFIFKYIRFVPWLVICVGICSCLAYLKIRYSTSIFREQSTLLIKNDQDNVSKGNARFDELFMSDGVTNLSNEIQILRSRPIMERVASNLGLQTAYYGEGKVKTSLIYPYPPLKLELLSKPDSSDGLAFKVTVQDSHKFLLNESKTPEEFGHPFFVGNTRCRLLLDTSINLRAYGSDKFDVVWQPLPYAAENLIGSVRVIQANDQSTILTLTFEGENPTLGNEVLNMMMKVYDTIIVEDKKKIQENTLKFINTQLYLLSDTLAGVQGGLQDFMVQNQVFDVDDQSKDFIDGLKENSKMKNEQDVRLAVANWLLDYIGSKKNQFELVPTNLGIEEPSLAQLIAEYNRIQLEREINLKTATPENPMIVGLENSLDKTRRSIYQALLNIKQAYIIAEASTTKQQQELQNRVVTMPKKSMRLLNIQRRQKILEELYSLLLQKKLETQIASASTISNSRILEPAIGGGMQIGPDRKKIYTLYLLIGVLIPVGFVALREILQDKVNGRSDIEKHTDVPILGEVGHSDTKQTLVVTLNSRKLISEQFRIVRTNLQYMISRKEKPVIMVTSSFSGEGKSFISTNIGAVMALSGKKTVIMEFDIRKPKIVSGLDLKRKMGITNYIIGRASFNDLLVKVEGVENLYVIPCGPIPPNPAEILLDKKLDELMNEVFANFEVVIMDTAPVGLVSDATNLGRFADCTLYIVRQGHTFRKQLGFIQDIYTSKKLPGLCLLINDVKPEGGYYGGYYGSRYGYYGGYGYGMGSGYFEDDNKKGGKRGSGFWKSIRKKFFS